MKRAVFGQVGRLGLPLIVMAASIFGTRIARGDDARDAQLAELQRHVQELDATMRQMQTQQVAWPGDPVALPPPIAVGADPALPAANVEPEVTSAVPPQPTEREGIHTSGFPLAGWNSGFYLRSDDLNYQLHITGQLQADYRGFFDHVDTATSPDTFLIRKARLGIEAKVLNYYEFRLLPDFAGSSLSKSITDAYMNVHYWDALQLEMGKFKQPFSYEQLIQDRYSPLMERSMIDQLVPQRDEGVMIHGRKMFGDRLDYAVAISNGVQNDSTVDSNNSKDFNARIAVRPFNDPDFCLLKGLQFGISYGVGIENQSVGPERADDSGHRGMVQVQQRRVVRRPPHAQSARNWPISPGLSALPPNTIAKTSICRRRRRRPSSRCKARATTSWPVAC